MSNTSQRLIHLSAQPEGTPTIDHPRPERLVQGNPMRETWNRVDEALGTGLVETVGAEQAARVVVVGVKNAHLVKMVMEYRAETIAGER